VRLKLRIKSPRTQQIMFTEVPTADEAPLPDRS
jgi:hypothetical protein